MDKEMVVPRNCFDIVTANAQISSSTFAAIFFIISMSSYSLLGRTRSEQVLSSSLIV